MGDDWFAMRLRVDPWDPEYGASIEMDHDLDPPVGLAFDAETAGPWAPIGAPPLLSLPNCFFVDGVRRIDLRLSAEEDDVWGPALAGSWAAGCARSGPPAEIAEAQVERLVIAGNALEPPPLSTRVGGRSIIFTPATVSGSGPLDPLRELQNRMRDAEAVVARELCRDVAADLVVIDGPLSYGMSGCAIGMIKRQSRVYLDAERGKVLSMLSVGERTPIFRFGERRTERYSWYLRLARPRRIDTAIAGIVRLETAPGDLEAVRRLADLASATLPRFAPAPGWDPRAPQNLYPIAALESLLRHRLGDPVLIRRALELSINEEVAGGR